MKTFAICISLFLITNISSAQKNDNVWVFGYHYGPGYPVPGLDFYWGPPDTVGFYPPLDFIAGGCVSMSDASGNLQFYTNGDVIGNWNNNIIQNSTGYNSDTSSFYNQYWQGELSMQFPDHPNEYLLFHLYGTYYNNYNDLFPLNLYYSVIDMSANAGEGAMTQRRINIVADTLLPCSMQATKHANGRDWWIIVHKANSSAFQVVLFTPNGIEQVNQITTGPNLTFFTYSEGQSTFSPDGSMYAIAYNTYNSVYLFDFDRCTGNITFRDSSQIVPNDPNEWPVWGCSFSPSSRFLYATTNNDLYQFDTWAPAFDQSKKLVGTYDGYLEPLQTYFYRHCPGPDGKIYLTSWGSCKHLHVINNPDMPDTLCGFVQHQLQLVSYHSSTLPEFPNYRLGALSGSSCDSLSTEVMNYPAEKNYLTVVNSFQGKMMIRYRLSQQGSAGFIIYDILGKIIFQSTVNPGEHTFTQNFSSLKPGVYVAVISSRNETLSSRFIIE